MTLIVTTITEMGILQTSDSNLTSRAGNRTSTGRKVFPLRFCPGALALAGSYAVGRTRMDSWMPRAIDAYSATAGPTLGGLAHYLRDRLTQEGQEDLGLLIHIAGYATDGDGVHPEMWFVRNFKGIDPVTGTYVDRVDDFEVSEDFWARDYPSARRARHQRGTPFRHWYFNGFAPGRISYNALRQHLLRFFESVWSNPDWDFRPPTTLEEQELFTRLELNVITTLFEVSDYPAPFVGGVAQVEAIAAPAGSIAL